jgi:hypothetical protein
MSLCTSRKSVRESGGIAPLIHVGIGWNRFIFKAQCPLYPLNRRLVRPHTRNGRFGAYNNILPPTRIKPRLPNCETRDQVDHAILVPLLVASSSKKLKASVVCIETTLRSEIRIPVGARDFLLAHNAQTSSGVSPVTYSMSIGFFSRSWVTGDVMLIARFHIFL